MNRLQEIDLKHALVREILDKYQADGLWFQTTRNIAWVTAGAEAGIMADSETGSYSVLFTRDKRMVFTQNIEFPRLRDEEKFESFGFEMHVFDWTRLDHPLDHADLRASLHMLQVITDRQVEADLWAHRIQLMEPEHTRLRALGADAAAALEEAISATRPGDSEWTIGARLDAACRQRGGLAVVNLIATDDRISHFRHPFMTDKQVEKLVMMVVCMRRGGLVVAGTRFAHFGKVPAELHEKNRKIATVDATAMIASTPGRTLSDIFADIQAAYTAVGEDGQWKQHHQGGLISYSSRERLAKPGETTTIPLGGACAWNPSIVGIKSEDTILVSENGFEIVTAHSERFPTVEVTVNGKTVKRPGVLEL
ncbi:MAG: M24 family metallopeptidase [Anaerolineae bacterium]